MLRGGARAKGARANRAAATLAGLVCLGVLRRLMKWLSSFRQARGDQFLRTGVVSYCQVDETGPDPWDLHVG